MSIRSNLKALATPMPVYVTRPHSPHKTTGSLEVSIWIALLTMVLVLANIIGWGIYGLVELVGKVV